MKMIFIVLSLVISFSALAAEKMNVACTVGIEAERNIELDMNFDSDSVRSAMIVDGMKIPLPEVNLEMSEGLIIVTNTVGLDDVQKVAIPLPLEIFEDGSSYWILPVMLDDRESFAACIGY